MGRARAKAQRTFEDYAPEKKEQHTIRPEDGQEAAPPFFE
jgi:hypothetical protein